MRGRPAGACDMICYAASMSEQQCDVIIVGGGLVGATLAHALAHGGLSSAMVDTLDLPRTLAPEYDGRASAIAAASVRMLKTIGLWERLAPHAQPIWDIRVTDGDSPLFLHFDGSQVSGEEPLGQMLENRHIRFAQLGSLAQNKLPIAVHAPAAITSLERGPAFVRMTLSTGAQLKAPLVIACDGKHSKLRAQAGIRTNQWSYRQDAVIVTVHHRDPHGSIAHERFLPDGPFAILPMVDDDMGRHRSALVLTVQQGAGEVYLNMAAADLNAQMARRFGDFLGPTQVISPRWSYPLTGLTTERLTAGRLALVGDSAHSIHPIAGQGLNLGLRDVAVMAQVLVDAARTGLDLGSPQVLERYARWRRTDIMAMVAATDGLNRLFSNGNPVITLARRLGLKAVDRLPPLKKMFMRHASGSLGQLPRLLRGETL
jgi:2-octaprenyl-6-methoxyphenol hydroxylase